MRPPCSPDLSPTRFFRDLRREQGVPFVAIEGPTKRGKANCAPEVAARNHVSPVRAIPCPNSTVFCLAYFGRWTFEKWMIPYFYSRVPRGFSATQVCKFLSLCVPQICEHCKMKYEYFSSRILCVLFLYIREIFLFSVVLRKLRIFLQISVFIIFAKFLKFYLYGFCVLPNL